MVILDRYIAVTVVKGVLTALLILVAVAALFSFMAQLGDLTGRYGALQATAYMVLTLPRRAYELFPTAVLLGGLLSLGNLAANSELVVMRAAGVSVLRIARSVMQAGLVLMALAAVIGELVAPPGEQYAQDLRASARSGYITLAGGEGFWARDGANFVNVHRVLPDARLEDIFIYGYGDRHRLRSVTHAASAQYLHGEWVLHDVRRSDLGDDRVTSQTWKSAQWGSLLNPDLLQALTVAPENLSARSLYRYADYMKRNNLDARRYELAFWIKVMTPLSTLVMLFVAIPFVFGPLRSTGTGVRVLVGVLIGMGFYLLNQAFSYAGLVYGLEPLVSAALPGLLFAGGGVVALSRMR